MLIHINIHVINQYDYYSYLNYFVNFNFSQL